MSLGQQEGPGVCVRFALAYQRLQVEDEARRRWLCESCGIDPDKVTPSSPKLPLQLRKCRWSARSTDASPAVR